MKVFTKNLGNWQFLPLILVGVFLLIGTQKAHASIIDWQGYASGAPVTASGGYGSFNTSTNGVVGAYFNTFNIEHLSGSLSKLVMDYSLFPCTTCTGNWGIGSNPYNSNGIYINTGILFTDTNTSDHLTNVTIDPTTNMGGFTSSDVTFNGSQIGINWSGLFFTSSTIVALDLSSSTSSPSATPEPSTWVLFGTGILAMMGWTYRKKKSLQF